ncbi:hypothetical protein GCM10022247_36020 [Allokutzneria multivorans]|uniref:Orotidine 5'-phosphate decarboxylase domain-containing protein n=1 Tax=Allokutzneria multivorans TaxID=1142134 RepID=A0ABP7SE64_9PSEU
MALVVRTWTGRETRALRDARRMSAKEFAAHLGFDEKAVLGWEKGVSLQPRTQQALDVDLARAPEDVRARFEASLPVTMVAAGTLGRGSAGRTEVLLESLRQREEFALLPYVPPVGAVERLEEFLASSSRVYLLSGPAGSGKTALTHHLAGGLAAKADFQLFAVDAWDPAALDVAREILRYGSLPGGDDALLTLEAESSSLARTCVVVIDGIATQEQLQRVGRQVDAIVRQTPSPRLRFLLVIRTPPTVDTSAHPVLTAACFSPAGARSGPQPFACAPWTLVEARSVWDSSRSGGPAFGELPSSVQQLARLPLYMQLVRAAGRAGVTTSGTAYGLIEECVCALLPAGHHLHEQLGDLAQQSMRELIPSTLATPVTRGHSTPLEPGTAALVRARADGKVEFVHDVVGEFFLARRLAELLRERGRSASAISAFNELAVRAGGSARARGVFELTLNCLDADDPGLLAAAAVSPTISLGTALPLMLIAAFEGGCGFVSPEVLRACARRCEQDGAVDLVRALLRFPALYSALADDGPLWLLGVLRRFGVAVWEAVRECVENVLDAASVRALLAAADLDSGEEATFLARHAYLFSGDGYARLEALLGHESWRVRAALAHSVGSGQSTLIASDVLVLQRLVSDADYKVRAAAALTLRHLPTEIACRHLRTLLCDENWHVRDQALHAVLVADKNDLVSSALEVLTTDATWSTAPAHVQPNAQRFLLLHNAIGQREVTRGTHRALFGLLRESRTGWTRLPALVQETLLRTAAGSASWLVRREAEALAAPVEEASPREDSREAFRRRRGRRSLQVALDMQDIDDALSVARAAAEAGADFLEVGDPLIKRAGLDAVEQIKRAAPETLVVAEMMSADWGRDQVEAAAEAGADVILLIGPSTVSSVSAAVEAGRRLGVPIVLDVPTTQLTQRWIAEMERVGVDGFTVTTNIDLGIASTAALARARTIRSRTRLPVALSGGFSTTDHAIIGSTDWDILIVGRAVTDAVNPVTAARRMAELVHANPERHLR